MGWGGWGCRAEQRSDGVEIRCAVVFLMQQWAVRDANETLLLLLPLLLLLLLLLLPPPTPLLAVQVLQHSSSAATGH